MSWPGATGAGPQASVCSSRYSLPSKTSSATSASVSPAPRRRPSRNSSVVVGDRSSMPMNSSTTSMSVARRLACSADERDEQDEPGRRHAAPQLGLPVAATLGFGLAGEHVPVHLVDELGGGRSAVALPELRRSSHDPGDPGQGPPAGEGIGPELQAISIRVAAEGGVVQQLDHRAGAAHGRVPREAGVRASAFAVGDDGVVDLSSLRSRAGRSRTSSYSPSARA